MNVYEYLKLKFGSNLPAVDRRKELQDLPLGSVCGGDCKEVIDVCVDYLFKLSQEYPSLMKADSDFRRIIHQKLAESAIETCLVYYLG